MHDGEESMNKDMNRARSCDSKVGYAKRSTAKRVIRQLRGKGKKYFGWKKFMAYKCVYCGDFHIGSRKRKRDDGQGE